ncbi:MAG TPA: erythromycin esterase family protein [Thermoanaerobaculia bacterium]
MRAALAAFILASTALAASAQLAPLQPRVWPLAGDDPALSSTADLAPLRSLIGNASIVALGESYHTSAGFYRMKHRLFRYLVSELGFRALAIESLWQGAERAGDYVQTCSGTPERAIADHINVWQSSEYADLVRWMCQWNSAHPDAADKITLFGFDIQQPWYDGPALIAFLERAGVPRSDPRSKGIESCEAVTTRYPFGEIPPERHQTCLAALAEAERLIDAAPARERDVLKLRVVGLRAWENSVFLIAHDYYAGYNARDEAMAYAFEAQRAMKAPGAKTVVWAANSHIARTPLPRGERPFGSYLAATHGRDYVNFALAAYDTEIDFPGFGCGPVNRTPGSFEDVYGRGSVPALLIDTRSRFVPRRSFTIGIDEVRPYRDYTGAIVLAHSPKMHPYVWAPCR